MIRDNVCEGLTHRRCSAKLWNYFIRNTQMLANDRYWWGTALNSAVHYFTILWFNQRDRVGRRKHSLILDVGCFKKSNAFLKILLSFDLRCSHFFPFKTTQRPSFQMAWLLLTSPQLNSALHNFVLLSSETDLKKKKDWLGFSEPGSDFLFCYEILDP